MQKVFISSDNPFFIHNLDLLPQQAQLSNLSGETPMNGCSMSTCTPAYETSIIGKWYTRKAVADSIGIVPEPSTCVASSEVKDAEDCFIHSR